MNFSAAASADLMQRGIGSAINRAVKRVLKPITRWLEKLVKLVTAPFEVMKRMVQATPRMLTPDLPSLSRVIDILLFMMKKTLLAALILPKATLYMGRDGIRITAAWMGDNFPTASWRRVDNIMGKHWLVGTGGLVEGLRFLAPGMVQLAVPQPGLSFKGTLGCYHGYIVGHYGYRIIGPFVSGCIATLIVSPEWLLRLAADLPGYVADMGQMIITWTGWALEEFADALMAILTDGLGALTDELLVPVKYYGRLIDWIFRPLMSIF